jgi:hypothetical protein
MKYDIVYRPTAKHPLSLKIPRDWRVYAPERPYYSYVEPLDQVPLWRGLGGRGDNLPIHPNYHYILDDRDTRSPSKLLLGRWIKSKERVDGEKFFVLKYQGGSDNTDEWIFEVASELKVELLSAYRKQPKKAPQTKREYRVFSLLQPSSEVGLDVLQSDLSNEDKVVVLATKRESCKSLRNSVNEQLEYMSHLPGMDRNTYSFYLLSNKRSYKKLVKNPNAIHVNDWLEQQMVNLRNYRYERFKESLVLISDLRRRKGLLDYLNLPTKNRYSATNYYIRGMEYILDNCVLSDKRLHAVFEYNVLTYNVSFNYVSSPGTSLPNRAFRASMRRWDRYLTRFFPEIIDNDMSIYDFTELAPLLNFALVKQLEPKLLAELVDCINYKYEKSLKQGRQ